jgi:diguanylate cyclase (GGDEF)-like protein
MIFPPRLGSEPPLTLGEEAIVVGSDETCGFVVDEPSVSRCHARIEPTEDGYAIVDLGSITGLFVNGIRVESARLESGDHIELGDVVLRFLASGSVEAMYHEEMYRLSTTDELTGIANRGCLERFLGRELSRSFRHQRSVAILMFDVDNFKQINDRLGHLGGDYVLRTLAECLSIEVRAEDLLARYGGDEFVWVLAEGDGEAAAACASRACSVVASHRFEYSGVPCAVSISVGTAWTTGNEVLSPRDLLSRADKALYRSKHIAMAASSPARIRLV